MNFLVRLLVNAVAIFALAYVLPGVSVSGFGIALIAAFVLALLNAFVKPLLIIFTIPITIFTLGLFLLVINALIIMLADYFIDSFEVLNFWWALLFGLLLSLVNGFFAGEKKD